MRKLVTIRQISNIFPINGADRIEVAVVDGWEVIVRKGEFSVGDYILYFEIDSFIPQNVAPFLVKNNKPQWFYQKPGTRLRTIKMRGQISQGLIMPLSTLKDTGAPDDFIKNPEKNINRDVSSFLNVIKYEREEVESSNYGKSLDSITKHPFPSDIQRTDQERVQNLAKTINSPETVEYSFEATEKLDGTSCTICLRKNNELDVCSRNTKLYNEGQDTVYGFIAKKYDLKNRLRKYKFLDKVLDFLHFRSFIKPVTFCGLYNLAFQGEIIGPKIQCNKYKLNEPDFFVYDIYDVDRQEYLPPADVRTLCNVVGLKHVPVISDHYNITGLTVDDIVKSADGTTHVGNNPVLNREGLVFKSNTVGKKRVSFKAISNKFLLKDEE